MSKYYLKSYVNIQKTNHEVVNNGRKWNNAGKYWAHCINSLVFKFMSNSPNLIDIWARKHA